MRSEAVTELPNPNADAGVVHERVTFDGPSGRLSGALAYPEVGTPDFAALIVGPHPYMGGTMDNPLLVAIASAMVDVGGAALRFDYGGTGDSEGPPIDVAESMAAFWKTDHAPEDHGRIEDVAAARRYLDSLAIEPLAVVGYSFGCFAALRGWKEPAPKATALISPTVSRHDFSSLMGWRQPMLVIHGDNDFATPAEAVCRWFERLPEPKQRCYLEKSDHFFLRSEAPVARRCASFVAGTLRGSFRTEGST